MYVTQRYHRGRCGCGRKVVMYSVVAAHVAPENQRSKTVPTVFGASAWLPLFDARSCASPCAGHDLALPLESLQACDRVSFFYSHSSWAPVFDAARRAQLWPTSSLIYSHSSWLPLFDAARRTQRFI